MKFWEDLSPMVQKAIIAGAILLGVLLAARHFVMAPTAEVAPQRGIK